jgi:hypothetical protein
MKYKCEGEQCELCEDCYQVVKDLADENRIMREALEQITQSTHEAAEKHLEPEKTFYSIAAEAIGRINFAQLKRR